MKARATEIAVHDDDATRTLRFSAPYARIEIDAARPSLVALTSGSFEAAWFVSPDDIVQEQTPAAEPASTYWMWIVASAATFVVGLIAGLAIT